MELQPINVKSIKPCPTNPRKDFPQEMLANLAASIKLHGVLVPLIVREFRTAGENGTAGKKAAAKPAWELVDGECRWRAAEIAGLVVVPCEVRELTDAQVLEIQLTTFLQRTDIGDLEKAEACQRMMDEQQLALEDVAARIGKSPSTLRGMLALTRCSERMREALRTGGVVSAVAQLVARIPDAESRTEAEDYALCREEWAHRDPPSYKSVKAFVQQHCMIELKQAPFSRQALDLVENTPDCDSCLKRAGNLAKLEPEAYEGVRGDICTDPGCFHAKAEAWMERVKAEAAKEGLTLLSAEQQKRCFTYGGVLSYEAPYVDLAQQCLQDTGKKNPRSYKQLLEKHVEPGHIFLAFDRGGVAHRLVHKDVARPILLKEHAINLDRKEEACQATMQWREEKKKEQAKKDEQNKQALAYATQAAATVTKIAEGEKGLSLRLTRLLRELLDECFNRFFGPEQKLLVKWLGIKGTSVSDTMDQVSALLKKQGPDDVWGTAAALLTIFVTRPGRETKRAKEILDFLGVDTSSTNAAASKKAKAKKRKQAVKA